MSILCLDAETRSAVSIKAGANRYASDASTSIWCIAFAQDDGGIDLWVPGTDPAAIIAAINGADQIVAHNAAFERALYQHILIPKFGFPEIPLAKWRCSMAMCLTACLPGKLEKAAAALGLNVEKDKVGKLVMQKLSKPRKGVWYEPTAAELEDLYRYCRQDVEIERRIYHALPLLSETEQQIWQLDQVINDRGFYVDRALAAKAHKLVQDERSLINAKLAELTCGKIKTVGQRDQILAFVRERGHQLQDLTEDTVTAALDSKGLDEQARQILGLRQAGGSAASSKLPTLLMSVGDDNRLRNGFRYYGASNTGRFSGSGFQAQNLASEPANVSDAITAIMSGDVERVRAIGPLLETIGSISRAIICAPENHQLVGADLSGIESRVVAWLAGETRKVEQWRKFDATKQLADEPYYRVGTDAFRLDQEIARTFGKIGDLAFGFGGSVDAWRKFMPDDLRSDDEIFKGNVEPWRKAHPRIVAFWYDLQNACLRAVRNRQPVTIRNLVCLVEGTTLFIQLPSGRRLAYPHPHIAIDSKGHGQITCRRSGIEKRLWHGTFVENVVQAVSRDLLVPAMLRLENAGFPIVLHVHDECVAEVKNVNTDVDKFVRLMIEAPPWASGLPISAKGWAGKRYVKKADTPSVAKSEPIPEPEAISVSISKSPTISVEPSGDKIICPFHNDHTPSMHVYGDHLHCFVCGAHVGHVDFVMMTESVDRDEAIRLLGSGHPLSKFQHSINSEADDAEGLALALSLWEEAKPIQGTLAEAYLRDTRKLGDAILPGVDVLRFHPNCPFASGIYIPCLLAKFSDVLSDEFAGIHRIALRKLPNGDKRKMLGRYPRPKAIKLFRANGKLFVSEGIETGLAATCFKLTPVWAAGSDGGIAKFPILDLQLTLLVDRDEAGQRASAQCRERYHAAGRMLKRLQTKSPLHKDFNDVLIRGADNEG